MRHNTVRSEQGSTLVETAIAATLMLGVVFSLFELFMAFYSYHYVSYIARDAARYAIVRGTDCSKDSATMPNCDVTQAELQTYLRSINFPGINPNNITVTMSWYSAVYTETNTSISTSWAPCLAASGGVPNGCDLAPSGNATSGNAVKVTVSYLLPLDLPFFSNQSLTMSSSSQMVIAQ